MNGARERDLKRAQLSMTCQHRVTSVQRVQWCKIKAVYKKASVVIVTDADISHAHTTHIRRKQREKSNHITLVKAHPTLGHQQVTADTSYGRLKHISTYMKYTLRGMPVLNVIKFCEVKSNFLNVLTRYSLNLGPCTDLGKHSIRNDVPNPLLIFIWDKVSLSHLWTHSVAQAGLHLQFSCGHLPRR